MADEQPSSTRVLDTPDRDVTSSGARPRISELDALRGFALCGILVVNLYQQLLFVRGGLPNEFPQPVALLFHERFVPLFAVLFGAGFGLFLDGARARTAHPRAVLARRLVVLLLIGALHFVLHPGEVLTSYALAGLVVLLPVSLLPLPAVAVVGALLLFVGPQVVVGYGLVPGLVVVGYALALARVPEALARRTDRVAAVFAGSTALAVAWLALRLAEVPLPYVNVVGGLGGGASLLPPTAAVVTSTAYATGFLLLLRSSVGRPVGAVLAPMGRMALTNYLSATVVFVLTGPLLGIDSRADAPQIAGLAVAVLVAQALWSRWWLARYRFGPAEWAWRCLTWLRRAPLRRADLAAAA